MSQKQGCTSISMNFPEKYSTFNKRHDSLYAHFISIHNDQGKEINKAPTDLSGYKSGIYTSEIQLGLKWHNIIIVTKSIGL